MYRYLVLYRKNNGEIISPKDVMVTQKDIYPNGNQKYWRVFSREFVYDGEPYLRTKSEELLIPTLYGLYSETGDYTAWFYLVFDGLINISEDKKSINGSSRKKLSGKLIIKDGIEIINDGAFDECSLLTEVIIPNSVKIIGMEAFDDCSLLKNIIIPDSVTTIREWAFFMCDGLTEIIIPDSVTTIGSGAFTYCSNLKTAILSNSIKIIEGSLFSSCENLTTISIPKSVIEIKEKAFLDCTNLKTISIPKSVTQFGFYTFLNSGLTDIYYEGTETQWKSIINVDACDIPENTTIHFNSDI